MESEIKKWMEKIEGIKKGEMDLSKDEDLSIALMNLISIEEHLYFSAMKTNNQEYINMLNSVREIRKELLKKMLKNPKGEEWCISKHLLASAMRLIEVGTKELSSGSKDEANNYFNIAFKLYSLFFAINLGKVKIEKIKLKSKRTLFQKFSNIVKKILDCCKE